MKPNPRAFSDELISYLANHGISATRIATDMGAEYAEKVFDAWNGTGVSTDAERLKHIEEIIAGWRECKAHAGVAKNPDVTQVRTVKPNIRELVFTKEELRAVIDHIAARRSVRGDEDAKAFMADSIWAYLTDKFWIQPQATEFVVQGREDTDPRLNPVIKYMC